MEKRRKLAAGLGGSVGLGMAVYLLLQLLLALLVVKGILPEERVTGLQVVSGGIAALLGGLWAARALPWGPLPAALAAAAGIAAVTALAGLVIYDEVLLTGDTLLRVAVMLAGGLAAGLLAGGGRGGRRRKKRTVRAARRS